MTKRTVTPAAEPSAASPGPSATPSMAMALQAAWLGPLGRYVGAGELVDVADATPEDVAAWVAAGVLRPVELGQETGPGWVVSGLADGWPVVDEQSVTATIMQDKE